MIKTGHLNDQLRLVLEFHIKSGHKVNSKNYATTLHFDIMLSTFLDCFQKSLTSGVWK